MKPALTAKPDTKFQVRNTGAIAVIPEKISRKDRVAFSIASSVFMSPPDFPGELSPDFKEAETSGQELVKRVKKLVDGGRVIDVVPGKQASAATWLVATADERRLQERGRPAR
jgi:hypothetical protein